MIMRTFPVEKNSSQPRRIFRKHSDRNGIEAAQKDDVNVHRDKCKAPELRWVGIKGEMRLPFHPHLAHHAEAWKPGELLP